MLINKEKLSLLISNEQIQVKVKECAKYINEKYADKKVLIIGILNGVFVFMADLVREINLQIEIDFLAATSYIDTQSSGNLKITKDLNVDIKGYHVILLEDILDTGFTLSKVIKMLQVREPKSLEVITLLDKKEKHTNFKEDYYALISLEKDHFLVGYGLDCSGQYRNLKDIYVVNQ